MIFNDSLVSEESLSAVDLDFLGYSSIRDLMIKLEDLINTVKETSDVESWKTYSFNITDKCEISFEMAETIYNYVMTMEELLKAKNDMIKHLTTQNLNLMKDNYSL